MTVDWVCADFVANPPEAGAYDLVSAHYPALPHSVNDEAIKAQNDREGEKNSWE